MISHEYIPFRTPFFVPISSAFIWCRLPEPTPQELLEGRGAQHHRLCGSFESHGQGCEFELPFYRLMEPTKSANYSTSTYVALPVLRAARIPVSTLSHIHVRPVLNIDIQRMMLGTFAPKSAEGAVCFELQNTTRCETNRHIQVWFAAVRRGDRIDASNFAQRPTKQKLLNRYCFSSVKSPVFVRQSRSPRHF